MEKLFRPHPALQEFISGIYYIEGDLTQINPPDTSFPFAPTHPQFISFDIGNGALIRDMDGKVFTSCNYSVTMGPQIRPLTIDLGTRFVSIAVAFHPGGMFRVIGVPMFEMVERYYNTTHILGPEINEIIGRLHENTAPETRIAIIEHYFLQKLNQVKPACQIDKALRTLVKYGGNLSVDWLASESCMSTRQFERKCKERVGLPPKHFSRLIRFSKAYKLKEHYSHLSWLDITHQCGYYDQMHLIRDFKEFAFCLPGTLGQSSNYKGSATGGCTLGLA
jgi:AraC-like DNA-binding protein